MSLADAFRAEGTWPFTILANIEDPPPIPDPDTPLPMATVGYDPEHTQLLAENDAAIPRVRKWLHALYWQRAILLLSLHQGGVQRPANDIVEAAYMTVLLADDADPEGREQELEVMARIVHATLGQNAADELRQRVADL